MIHYKEASQEMSSPLLLEKDQVALVSLHNSLAKLLPPSIIRCITSFFTDLDTPLPRFLDSLPGILHLLKVAHEAGRKELKEGVKERMAVMLPKEASSDEVQITDGKSFPKRQGKKRRAHYPCTPMNVKFLRRSTRKTPSAFWHAERAPVESSQ